VKAAAPQPNGRRRATLRESPSKAWHVLRLYSSKLATSRSILRWRDRRPASSSPQAQCA